MDAATARAAFEARLAALRAKLHRYCARMLGSAVEGEDVVQDAMVRALQAFDEAQAREEERWVFKIAHNAALDALRKRSRVELSESVEDEPSAQPSPDAALSLKASLGTFMRLPVSQRSAVILMDVLGYSLEEVGEAMGLSLPAVKSSLHRGRTNLRGLVAGVEEPKPLETEVRRKLSAYAERFNAHDFDAVRAMLAEEVRLDLANRARLDGKPAVSNYFHNYNDRPQWQWVPGTVDGQPALLCRDVSKPGSGWKHFALLEWKGEQVVCIRDFVHAPYVLESAVVEV